MKVIVALFIKGFLKQRSKLVYDPNYDERNIGGGKTDNSDFIIFFRRYNAETSKTVDVNYIVSKDGGKTFTERNEIKGFEKRSMNFITTGKGTYMVPLFEDSYDCEVRTFKYEQGIVTFDGVLQGVPRQPLRTRWASIE